MKVPLLDLRAQYAQIKNEVLAAVGEVLESQVCILGPKVAELEEEIARLSDCRFAIGVSSGTDALLACLMAKNIGPGDEVITTPFTFFATAGCVSRTGARPVFVDVDAKTYNIDAGQIEAAITPRTKAIIPVHLFGQMADMDPIVDIARRHGLFVIEDAAQAISATYKGHKAGSMGDVGCFSFFPSKNLGAAGDGGMMVTNSPELHKKLVAMRSHGSDPKYYHSFIGGNFRLDAIQAAVLLVKLRYLDSWSEARRRNADAYNRLFAGSPIVTPWVHPDTISIYNQYVIRVPKRDELVSHLKSLQIGHEIYYPLPLHLQQCFSDLGYKKGDLPNSERAAEEVLALPIYPELEPAQLEFVGNTILHWVAENLESASSERLRH